MIHDITAGKITGLLNSWDQGDRAALDRLLPLMLGDLKRLARHHLAKKRPDHTLRPGGLVNEMYLKLSGSDNLPSFKDRSHFFSFASRLMRLILIDYARMRNADKRQGAHEHVPMENAERVEGTEEPFDLVALRHALDDLGELAPRQRRVVELRFLLGLRLDEIADALEISPATVSRDWAAAKAWLYSRLATD